jgi:prefoldin subunit 5
MLLQFVEILNADRHTELLEGDRHIVGHKGDIVPQLCNGRISQRHATIARIGRQWLVVDGYEGKPSTNGLWAVTEGRIDKGMLANVGDRIYLLRDVDAATECYLEVVAEASKALASADRSTLSMENRVNALDSLAHENRSKIVETAEKVGELEQKIQLAGETLIAASKHWRQLILGSIVLSFVAGAGLTAIGFYRNLDQVFDRIFPEQSK